MSSSVLPHRLRTNHLPTAFRGSTMITSIQYTVPEHRDSIEHVESLIEINLPKPMDIKGRLGMNARRVAAPGQDALSMAIDVAQKLFDTPQLDGKDVHVDEIDLVIYYGISRAYAEPATAAAVQQALGIKRAIAFDVSDACMGFSDAWIVADSMISNGVVHNALLVAGETLTRVAQASIACINKGENPHEHFASLSFGDGASAAVIRSNGSCEKGIFLEVATRETYAELVDACKIEIDFGAMRSRPMTMFLKAGQVFPMHIEAAFSKLGWSPANVDVFITHQASLRAIERAAAQLGGTEHDYHMTFEEFGNIGSVSVPLTLAHYLEKNPIDKPERRIVLVCYGSGFGAALLVLIQKG